MAANPAKVLTELTEWIKIWKMNLQLEMIQFFRPKHYSNLKVSLPFQFHGHLLKELDELLCKNTYFEINEISLMSPSKRSHSQNQLNFMILMNSAEELIGLFRKAMILQKKLNFAATPRRPARSFLTQNWTLNTMHIAHIHFAQKPREMP